MLEKVYESHNKWINTVLKMGANKPEAQDIVGNMYLTIGQMLNKGLDISYGDDVNYFYIYKTLKTSYLQMCLKKKKENKTSIDLVLDLASGDYIDYNEANDVVEAELDKLHWYDKKVYTMVQDEYSITELSKKTNITYHSLYNTFRKVKDRLKDKVK
jgi:hypothetical protein|tara:strand:+ start:355 stop:825 length:471 start_codon:yes stop_codon:yes gene_type:complete